MQFLRSADFEASPCSANTMRFLILLSLSFFSFNALDHMSEISDYHLDRQQRVHLSIGKARGMVHQ